MTLSGRMQRKLRDVGFVNITGLYPHRPVGDAFWVGSQLGDLLGHSCEAVLTLQDHQDDDARVCVDAIVTREGEVWVAPAGTSQLEVARPLIRKLAPAGYDDVGVDFEVKIDDFFRAAVPKVNWAFERERARS
mgnify:CR=1 FL=1